MKSLHSCGHGTDSQQEEKVEVHKWLESKESKESKGAGGTSGSDAGKMAGQLLKNYLASRNGGNPANFSSQESYDESFTPNGNYHSKVESFYGYTLQSAKFISLFETPLIDVLNHHSLSNALTILEFCEIPIACQISFLINKQRYS
jgi:hypothetical protein